ncbi:threonine-phosphate decarboxylase CobD [uncultured Rhodoblastus sp.]|uniref:threonine-phosphate decarboxylase CobD n=1 Tax=uncultured Rhodoblastus sp. TaxID=543037 RepID=UPI0025E22561|nr:threonine-phosphate decarboxylase CobD [uncultured Rhodoblastus sp.]
MGDVFRPEQETNRLAALATAYHGGGLAAARRRFPLAPEPWLDLSTGINALPYACGGLSPEAFARLPEAEAIAKLEAAAAQFFGLGAGAECVAAPGTQSLIQLLPRLFPAQDIALLDFTYAEHERVWALSGARAQTRTRLDDLAQADVAIVVNPNNPDGRLVAADDLVALAHRRAARAGLLIIDEAFADFLPRAKSLSSHLPLPGAIVLRSFGKTFGLAGLRLGFALCGQDLARKLRAALGPWAVSGAAVEIGVKAYGDARWLAQSAARLEQDGAHLDDLLRKAGFVVLGGTPLFRLARHDEAEKIFERLGAGGVLTRPFAGKPGWLRFGIPHRGEDFDRLAKILPG